jgi:hypothetical protein
MRKLIFSVLCAVILAGCQATDERIQELKHAENRSVLEVLMWQQRVEAGVAGADDSLRVVRLRQEQTRKALDKALLSRSR